MDRQRRWIVGGRKRRANRCRKHTTAAPWAQSRTRLTFAEPATACGSGRQPDRHIDADAILSVVSEGGETKIAPLDQASRQMLREHLFSAGELLRMNQLAPDRKLIEQQSEVQIDLFAEPRS